MSAARRVSLEPACLLHHYAWRDTSRIVELLTRNCGRVSLIARAARQAKSPVGSALQPFARLLVSWNAKGELGYLTSVERVFPTSPTAVGEVAQRADAGPRGPSPGLRPASPNVLGQVRALNGDRLMSGFYANELLIKLLQRSDPHAGLFDAYCSMLDELHRPDADPARALRIFEKRLLEELGWGLNLASEASSGRPLEPARSYRYGLDSGAEAIDGVAEGILIFSGTSLLSLAHERLHDARSLADARRLLRAALDRLLDGRALRTREVMHDMRLHAGRHEGG
jgi:DNA repair protein RecO (recombination protein O)